MINFPIVPRCVVTGNHNGKSTIINDNQVTNVKEHLPGLIISDIWSTNSMPTDLKNSEFVENKLYPETPKNGSYVRYIHVPPDQNIIQEIPTTLKNEKEKHPLMHKTLTLDYIIILSGEIFLILEEGEVLLKTGDIVIQRATNHAWSNRSNNACIFIAVLIDANNNEA